MTYSHDFRWRAVVLAHVYGIEVQHVSELLGSGPRTARRWYALFLRDGVVSVHRERALRARWPQPMLQATEDYVKAHPTFYIEELRDHISARFPDISNLSTATICRVLNFDLNLSREVLTKAAREAQPAKIRNFQQKLLPLYSLAHQFVFIDETSKDGRHAYQRYAWSKRNTSAVVNLPFARGKRLSVMAALDVDGFVAWEATEGTFTRSKFHQAFIQNVIPQVNPWPLPRSIVVLDNAKIHAYPELEAAIHQCGARLVFLPPSCPQLNPVEVCFGVLKRWIQKHANLLFPLYLELVLDLVMRRCTRQQPTNYSAMFGHCGYTENGLRS